MADEAHDDNGSGGDLLALGARGYSCLLFDDPETAWKLHQETHLIAWRGESDGDLRVDRFDARNLLEDRNSFRQLKKRKRDVSDATDAEIKSILAGGEEAVETEEQILHRLRYGDYAVEFPPSEETFAVENKFPYQYSELASDEESDGEPFEPSENVPGYLTLPKTKKRNAILEATANKVRGHPQLEVMLKVKLGASAKFRFLNTSHALHAYYCFLRDEKPLPVPEKSRAVGVSLLGAEYEQSSDEDDDKRPAQQDGADKYRKSKSARHR